MAFLPLYIRISSVSLERISKSNALFCLIPLMLLMFGRKIRKFPVVLSIIFAAVIAHLALVQFEPAAFNGIYQAVGISLGLIFVIQYHEHFKEDHTEVLLNFMCAGALIQSCLSIFQFLGLDLYEHAIVFLTNSKVVVQSGAIENLSAGSLLNPNVLGAYLALCLPAFFRGNLIWASLPVVATIINLESLMPIAAMLGGLSYYLFAKSKKKETFFYIASAVCFYLIILLFPKISSGRVDIWSQIFREINLEHFFFGMSPSWLVAKNFHIGIFSGRGLIREEHNDFLTIFNIFGILGVVAVGYLFHKVIENQYKNRIFASIMFAAFVLMHGSFPLHLAVTAFIIMIALSHCLKGNYVVNLDR